MVSEENLEWLRLENLHPVLAYVMWKAIEPWQSRAGLGNSPRTILEELGRIQSVNVVLPAPINPAGLGLELPERLRAPVLMAQRIQVQEVVLDVEVVTDFVGDGLADHIIQIGRRIGRSTWIPC